MQAEQLRVVETIARPKVKIAARRLMYNVIFSNNQSVLKMNSLYDIYSV